MTTPRITAIVVVHGSPAATVDACIESLLASIDVDVTVALVDNASPDGGAATDRWRTNDRVDVIRSERNGGFAAGVNQGLRRRRAGDLVFLLNDDATVASDALSICAAHVADAPDDVIAIAPRVMLANEPDRIDSIGIVVRPNGEAFNAHIGQRWTEQVADGADVLGTCFCAGLFRSDAFDEGSVGLLDERFHLYYEDIDWALRAQRIGRRTIAATTALVLHQHAASTRKLGEPARYELVQRNLLLCVAKNFRARTAARAFASRFVVHAKGVISGPYRAQRLRSIARAVAGLPSALAARRALPRHPQRPESELFSYADGLSPNFSVDTYRSEPTS